MVSKRSVLFRVLDFVFWVVVIVFGSFFFVYGCVSFVYDNVFCSYEFVPEFDWLSDYGFVVDGVSLSELQLVYSNSSVGGGGLFNNGLYFNSDSRVFNCGFKK